MYNGLSEWLSGDPADVVCLQEVTLTPGLTGWTTFKDGERSLPQRANLYDDIRKLLPRHHAIFVASDAGPVRSYVTLREWTIEDRPRNALATRLMEPATGRGVTVIQVHGLRDPAGKHDTPARRAQAQRLTELVGRATEANGTTVLCGDFNLLPDSDTFRRLGEVGLVDLVGDADTRTSRYPKPIRHASYMLVSHPSAITRFKIVTEPEVSDHRALLLEI